VPFVRPDPAQDFCTNASSFDATTQEFVAKYWDADLFQRVLSFLDSHITTIVFPGAFEYDIRLDLCGI
jgi:hypothetical protein